MSKKIAKWIICCFPWPLFSCICWWVGGGDNGGDGAILCYCFQSEQDLLTMIYISYLICVVSLIKWRTSCTFI